MIRRWGTTTRFHAFTSLLVWLYIESLGCSPLNIRKAFSGRRSFYRWHLCTNPQVCAFDFVLCFSSANLIYQKWIRCSTWIYMTFSEKYSSRLPMLWKHFLFTGISEQYSYFMLQEEDPTLSVSSSITHNSPWEYIWISFTLPDHS